MDNQIIGSLTIGGTQWTIEIDNKRVQEDNGTWLRSLIEQKIIISDSYEGKPLNYQILEKNIWEAIIYIITTDIMYYGKEFKDSKVLTPFVSLFFQGISTLSVIDWEGSLKLGSIEYTIQVDNKEGWKEVFFGRCHPTGKIIQLVTESSTGTKYKEEFIWTTFYHELFHAIAFEMGKHDSKINSEKFVNVLSLFIHEAVKTLDVNFPE